MKFFGKAPAKGNKINVVIPRQNGDNILFVAEGVFDFKPFTDRFPAPKPPLITRAGGVQEYLYTDPKYKKTLQDWLELKMAWLFMNSLSSTPGLTWETVDMDDPTTWKNCEKELSEFLLPSEVNIILTAVTDACSLTTDKIEAATQSFLNGAEMTLLNSSSPISETENTQSSEVVKDSV